MNKAQKWWENFQSNPVYFRRFNGWATIVWFIASVPICLFLANSIPFLIFISVYAIVAAHLSAWQASRVEVKEDE